MLPCVVSVDIPLLLVAHQRAVVTEDVHGVLPMPARATVVLEAGLGKRRLYINVLSNRHAVEKGNKDNPTLSLQKNGPGSRLHD